MSDNMMLVDQGRAFELSLSQKSLPQLTCLFTEFNGTQSVSENEKVSLSAGKQAQQKYKALIERYLPYLTFLYYS
jgi:hypothetical protein